MIKVVAAGSPSVRSIDEHAADFVLLDAPIPGGGVPFEWGIVGDLVTKHKILLAGGLRPDNVAEAVRQCGPGASTSPPASKPNSREGPGRDRSLRGRARAAAEQPTES